LLPEVALADLVERITPELLAARAVVVEVVVDGIPAFFLLLILTAPFL